ncbi:MAG TPA: alpha/beta family hydrolase [Acidobacteriaceae bacterium]
MSQVEQFIDASSSEPAVRGFLHRPTSSTRDGVVLTHGAGANCQTPLLVGLADALCASGMMVLRYDLPFRQLRPKGPPPPGSAGSDQLGLRSAASSMRKLVSNRVFLGGHSYGGRQATMLAASDAGWAEEEVQGLLLLSYPLHPPKRPHELRTSHFPKILTPGLFIHGERDGFGSIDEMAAALQLIPARTELLPITGAGHELISGKTKNIVAESIAEIFRKFFPQE